MPRDDASTARQVGPILDRSLLDASIYDLMVHKIWMCCLIYAQLPLNMQRPDKTVTLLPMFFNKLADLALREACSAAAGGRFSKSVVGLYRYVGKDPGAQLITELNTTHMLYRSQNTCTRAAKAAAGSTEVYSRATSHVGDVARSRQGPKQGT